MDPRDFQTLAETLARTNQPEHCRTAAIRLANGAIALLDRVAALPIAEREAIIRTIQRWEAGPGRTWRAS